MNPSLKFSKPWNLERALEGVRKQFYEHRDKWLDNYFRGKMPEIVYGALLGRGELAFDWLKENGYQLRPARYSAPDRFTAKLIFGLYLKGKEVSSFEFVINHDGSFEPDEIAKYVYKPRKEKLIVEEGRDMKALRNGK